MDDILTGDLDGLLFEKVVRHLYCHVILLVRVMMLVRMKEMNNSLSKQIYVRSLTAARVTFYFCSYRIWGGRVGERNKGDRKGAEVIEQINSILNCFLSIDGQNFRTE